MTSRIISHLETFILPRRLDLFNKVLAERTRYFTVVLEDIYQPHNASAVLRTCDCFGIQDVHIIENNHEYRINPDVAMGSTKWINLYRYNEPGNNSPQTIQKLKEDGYRIVATTPHEGDVSLNNFDIHKGKSAIFFGTELKGMSEIVIKNADEFLKIPMYGFTESFNISVSAAIILHSLTEKMRQSDLNWQLSQSETNEIKLQWLKNSIKHSDKIVELFLKNSDLING